MGQRPEIGASDDRQDVIADPASATPATIIVENNDITGNVIFYGVAGGQPLNVDQRQILESRLKGSEGIQ